MPKMFVEKSVDIHAPAQKVYEVISDFHNWRPWSPWLICEPEADVEVRPDGKYYEWNGKRTGSGNMTILTESSPTAIDYDLTFLKPWKSQAKVQFRLNEQDGNTKVTWNLDSRIPFFMFWMKKQMEAFVGMDYERGLTMLKDYVEQGSVDCTLNFQGEEQFSGCKYLGIKRQVPMSKIQDMQQDFDKLGAYAHENSDNIDGVPFTIYHKWELVKGQVQYTAGIPVKDYPDSIPSGMITGSIPASKVYTLQHVGPYKFLGNAWTTMQMMMRGKEFKAVKGIHPWESYGNMPGEVPDKELITNIHFAVK